MVIWFCNRKTCHKFRLLRLISLCDQSVETQNDVSPNVKCELDVKILIPLHSFVKRNLECSSLLIQRSYPNL